MPIVLAEYDPEWVQQFEDEARRLQEALGDVALRIEHIGSTSVPGLAAKPVIDIQVSVSDVHETDAYRVPLESIGYTYATVPFPYFHRPEGWPHSHHVHVREAGCRDERRTIAFRDWLREHPDDRASYEELKRLLASDADAATAEGRYRYSEAKTEFIRDIEQRTRPDSGGSAS